MQRTFRDQTIISDHRKRDHQSIPHPHQDDNPMAFYCGWGMWPGTVHPLDVGQLKPFMHETSAGVHVKYVGCVLL